MLRWSNKRQHIAVFIALMLSAAWAAAQANDLPEVLKRGQIRIALYKDFLPYSGDGKGVDVEVAQMLAERLGVKFEPLWFAADENVDDDLRNMVWKGTVLGYGPADAMIHVPVDKEYMSKNDKVLFFAPYYRERFAIARNVQRIPKLESMDPLRKEKIGVEIATYPDAVLLSAEGGVYRENVIHFKSSKEAIDALKKGQVAAVMAMQGELEAGLVGAKDLEISEPPMPVVNRRQWALGMAVQAGHDELARALQKQINEMAADGSLAKIFERNGIKYRAP